MKSGSIRAFAKTGFLLAILFFVLGSMNVSAALRPDMDDPDYVKRLNGGISSEADVEASCTSGVDSSRYMQDAVPNKYTGLKYYHSGRFKDYDIAHGIDVSKWNGNINWSQVKEDGISYAFLRIGYSRLTSGALNKDEMYDVNLAGIKRAQIPFGVYYFSQAITVDEAIAEAEYVLKLLRNEKLSLPVVFDSEDMEGGRLLNANLSKSAYTAINLAFCQTIEAGGYPVIIYNGINGFNNRLNTAQLEDKYEFWFARYNINTFYDGKYSFWQYSSSGKVKGISGSVDMNFWYRKKNTPMPEVEEDGPAVKDVVVAAEADGSIQVSWKALAGANSYEVWRADAYDGVYDKLTDTKELSYRDTGLTSGREYFYQVRGVLGNKSYGGFSEVRSKAAYLKKAMEVTTIQDVNLKAHAGANYDTITEIPAGVLLPALSVTRNVDGNTWYQVQTLVNGETVTGYISARQADIYVKKGSGLKAVKSTKQTITLKWKALPNVSGYYLYRSTAKNGTYELLAVIPAKKTTYTDKKLKTWCQYYYRIKGFVKAQEALDDRIKEKEDEGSLSAVCAASTRKVNQVRKARKRIGLYKYAGSNYKKLTVIPKSTALRVDYRSLDKRGKWWYHVKVTVDQKQFEGFVLASNVK